ncbi:MAG: DUF1705 domain-containing protein [Bacteroidales bacterium]|nr:DUF1705 domain-containing protein [Bacteroidales bacterium]
MKTKSITYISLIILISCLILVVTGSPILNVPLYKDSAFPLGTLVSWIGLITVTFAIYLTSNKIHRTNNSIRQIIRIVSGSTIILALLWGLIGFLFAGNWAFVFQNHDEFRGSIEASRYFWIFTASLVLLPVLLILTVLFMLLLKKLLRRSER